MRICILLFFYCSIFPALANADYYIFSKEGFQGIKDQEGNIVIPAVHSKLGWSNNSEELVNDVIGVRENDKWGLISIKNKVIIAPKFHSIEPLEGQWLKTSIEGRFSNKLFYGVIDVKGKNIIPNAYFSLEKIGNDLFIVSEFEKLQQRFGIISTENSTVTQTIYQNISTIHGLIKASRFDNTSDLFTKKGEQITSNLDSIIFNNGFVIYKKGNAGFLNLQGEIIHAINNKDIEVLGSFINPVPFLNWTVLTNQAKDTVLQFNADSIVHHSGNWLAFRNTFLHPILVDSFKNNSGKKFYKNPVSGKWNLAFKEGKSIDYDSIYQIGSKIILKSRNKVSLASRPSNKYSTLEAGLGDQFIVSKNGFWGLIDSKGNQSTPIKYDFISAKQSFYQVSYLNRFGVIGQTGTWIVPPEYEKVERVGELFFGVRGLSRTVFSKQGKKLNKIVATPIEVLKDKIVLKGINDQYGLLSRSGELFSDIKYNSITSLQNYLMFETEERTFLMHTETEQILSISDDIEKVGSSGEALFSIKRDGKWGFMDFEGRLIISNRYDSVQSFSQGMAAVKINGKWGFIDKQERLLIQPYYENTDQFKNNLTIVQENSRKKLIDKTGTNILNASFKQIRRTSYGKYIMVNDELKSGIADENGLFILSPAFSDLEDRGELIITKMINKYGIMDLRRNQVLPNHFAAIRIENGFTFVAK